MEIESLSDAYNIGNVSSMNATYQIKCQDIFKRNFLIQVYAKNGIGEKSYSATNAYYKKKWNENLFH
jgi:hypothetical protein